MSSTAAKVTQCPKLKLSRNYTVTFQSTELFSWLYLQKIEHFLLTCTSFWTRDMSTAVLSSLFPWKNSEIQKLKDTKVLLEGFFIFIYKQTENQPLQTHTHKASKFPRDLHGRTCTSTWESEIKSLWKCPDVSLFIASSRVFLNSVREP